LLAIVTVPLAPAMAADPASPIHVGSSTIHLADAGEAAALLGRRDGFVAALSPFDRAARLKTERAVSEAEYLRFVAAQTLPFSDDERRRLVAAWAAIDERLKQLDLALPLPPQISIIKTTGREEGQAAYCRGEAIVLPTAILDGKQLQPTLAHELFHILSSHAPALRTQLYGLVGFHPGGDVQLPESLRPRKITNPDAYRNDYRMSVQIAGKAADVVPVLFASSDHYDSKKGDEFFAYLVFKLLVVDSGALLEPTAVPDYAKKLGGNTEYIIHPEEVLADCFQLLVFPPARVASPELLERIKSALPHHAKGGSPDGRSELRIPGPKG
jgi:hypothetical protein